MTYVTVEDDDDEWVMFATAAAYTGLMVAWGCAVWGTGYYYPPYVGYGGLYPGYYPYYPTYGYSAWYNPWTGSYGRGAAVYGPYGGAGVGARYNPSPGPTRAARRRRAVRGSGGRHGYNARTGRTRAAGAAVRTAPAARRGLQPADRRVRRDASGLECVRQLGLDGRAPRR